MFKFLLLFCFLKIFSFNQKKNLLILLILNLVTCICSNWHHVCCCSCLGIGRVSAHFARNNARQTSCWYSRCSMPSQSCKFMFLFVVVVVHFILYLLLLLCNDAHQVKCRFLDWFLLVRGIRLAWLTFWPAAFCLLARSSSKCTLCSLLSGTTSTTMSTAFCCWSTAFCWLSQLASQLFLHTFL